MIARPHSSSRGSPLLVAVERKGLKESDQSGSGRRSCWWFSFSKVIRRLGLRAFSWRKSVEWKRYDIAGPGRIRVGITRIEVTGVTESAAIGMLSRGRCCKWIKKRVSSFFCFGSRPFPSQRSQAKGTFKEASLFGKTIPWVLSSFDSWL